MRSKAKAIQRGFSLMKTYQSRDKSLKILGFGSYEAYLLSDLWQEIREKVFMAKGRKCFCCGRNANSVHHTSYSFKTLSGNDKAVIDNAWPICGKCHKSVHFRKSGEFRKFRSARASFFRRKENAGVRPNRNAAKRLKRLAQMKADAAFHAKMCE